MFQSTRSVKSATFDGTAELPASVVKALRELRKTFDKNILPA